jgi:integrase
VVSFIRHFRGLGDRLSALQQSPVVGLTDPGLVLHSLRHGGITKLHGAGVQTNQVEMLAGHASNTVNGSVYTHRENIPLSLLREGLERLTYPDVVKALALRRK